MKARGEEERGSDWRRMRGGRGGRDLIEYSKHIVQKSIMKDEVYTLCRSTELLMHTLYQQRLLTLKLEHMVAERTKVFNMEREVEGREKGEIARGGERERQKEKQITEKITKNHL